MPVKPYRNLKKSPKWYARGTVKVWKDGEPVKISVDESTGTDCEIEAQGICDQITARVKQQNINNAPIPVTFNELAVEYIEAGKSDRFLEPVLKVFEDWQADQITDEVIDRTGREAYPHASEDTRWRQWRTPIKAVLNFRSKPKRRPKSKSRMHWFTPQQADDLIIALQGKRFKNPWGPAIGTFLFGTGARTGEALDLDGQTDVLLEYGQAVFRDPKNGEERWIDLPGRVIAALSLLPNLGEPGPLFRRHDGRPYTRRKGSGGELRRMFTAATEEVGLDPAIYTPHVCRHTWATWFYACTKDVLRLRELGGWKSEEYLRYTKIGSPQLAADVLAHGWEFSGKLDVEKPGIVKSAKDLG